MAYSDLVALSHADWSLFLLIVALRRRPNILGFVTTNDIKNSLLLSFSSDRFNRNAKCLMGC